MNTQLDRYFESAKNFSDFKNPLKENEFDAIIEKGNSYRKKIFNFKIIGGLFMISFCIFILLLFTLSEPENSVAQKQKTNQSENTHKSISSGRGTLITLQLDNTNTKTETKILENKTSGSIVANSYENTVTLSNEPVIISNPFRKYQRVESVSQTAVGSMSISQGLDFLEPGSFQNDAKGSPITGLLTLKLNAEELKKLDILNDNIKISYPIEYYRQMHPIPFRNNDIYRLDPDNANVAKNNYPVNGDTLLVKTRHIIELNKILDMSILLESTMAAGAYESSIKYDTLNGKITKNLKPSVIYSEYLENNGKNYYEVKADWNRRNLQGFNIEIKKFTGWDKNSYSMICPVVAAFRYNGANQKHVHYSYNSPITIYNSNKFDYSKLIPVEIKFSETQLIEKLILWYYPTDEFIDALPERYKKVLKKELDVIFSLEAGEIKYNEACKMIEQESFFDLCRIVSGALELKNIYPNPTTTSSSTLNFICSEPRNTEINIYDVQGNFIARLAEYKNLEAGNHNVKLSFGNLTTGIYIIGILTDKNEFVSQRLVIN